MGQSQLLLISIGVLIVGIAIFTAAGMFGNGDSDANKNAIIGDINQVARLAIRYCSKPLGLGGGGNSFVGFVLPNKFRTNLNGVHTQAALTPTILQITGVSALNSISTATSYIDTYGNASNWTFTRDCE
jgi:hypothetical protein